MPIDPKAVSFGARLAEQGKSADQIATRLQSWAGLTDPAVIAETVTAALGVAATTQNAQILRETDRLSVALSETHPQGDSALVSVVWRNRRLAGRRGEYIETHVVVDWSSTLADAIGASLEDLIEVIDDYGAAAARNPDNYQFEFIRQLY